MTAESGSVVRGDESAPVHHRFRSQAGEHLLIVPHSRLFDLPEATAAAVDANAIDLDALSEVLSRAAAGEDSLNTIPRTTPQSISLNTSATCNLACDYCYAARGSFGGAQPSGMAWETARAAIDRLLASADPAAPITVGFLGGEPFANRALMHRAVAYASACGIASGLDVRFSVTTNGTLLRDVDIELLRSHPFAVTVSVDGGQRVHDAQRPTPRGAPGSFEAMARAVRPLLERPGQAKVAARATVTRRALDLPAHFAAIVALGFTEVGFAPLRLTSNGEDALRDADWPAYLAALIAVAAAELERAAAGAPIRLTNLAVALKQIFRGFAAPYPCGAGGGYFSVAADGGWYACHRAIDRPEFRLGDNDGLDDARRQDFLAARHVHAHAPCRICWARYLCSGGCHQEASARSDSSCGFIRGWLDYCLRAYCELTASRPDHFGTLAAPELGEGHHG